MIAGLDDAIFTLHWELSAHDHASRDAATTKLKTFWAAVKNLVLPGHVFREVKWYECSPTPPTTVFRESILAAPAPGTPGTSGGLALPPQNAMSVTLKTVPRRHWGRFYLPGVTGTILESSSTKGLADPAKVDQLATAAAALCATSGANNPIIYSRLGGVTYGITSVQVDDVTDIVRRRRHKKATYKKQLTV